MELVDLHPLQLGQGSGRLVEAVALVTACAKTADQGQTEGLSQWAEALNGEGKKRAIP